MPKEVLAIAFPRAEKEGDAVVGSRDDQRRVVGRPQAVEHVVAQTVANEDGVKTPRLDGIEYEPVRGHGFLAVEFAWDQRHSFIIEVNAASRMVKNLAAYPGISAYINVAMKADISERLEFEIGFTENLEDQQSTIDFGGFAGLTLKL